MSISFVCTQRGTAQNSLIDPLDGLREVRSAVDRKLAVAGGITLEKVDEAASTGVIPGIFAALSVKRGSLCLRFLLRGAL